MSLQSRQALYEKLRDRRFREAFVASRIAQTIATQARVLRQRENLSQTELARRLGTSQNAIYRLENPKYGRPNISTLRELAAFYDVGLIVRFGTFSEIADWTTDLSTASMEIPNFDSDPGFLERKPPELAGVFPRLGQPSLEDSQLSPPDNVIVMPRPGPQLLTPQSPQGLAGCYL